MLTAAHRHTIKFLQSRAHVKDNKIPRQLYFLYFVFVPVIYPYENILSGHFRGVHLDAMQFETANE